MTTLADIGDRAVTTATFTNAGGTNVAPTTVTLQVMAPAGTLAVDTTTGFTSGGTGIYSYEFDLDEAGVWRIHWAGVGAAVAAGETTLRVRESVFA